MLTEAASRLKYAFRATEITIVIFAQSGSPLHHPDPASNRPTILRVRRHFGLQKARGICALSSNNIQKNP
jgi:hypothetical protein